MYWDEISQHGEVGVFAIAISTNQSIHDTIHKTAEIVLHQEAKLRPMGSYVGCWLCGY